MPDNPRDLNNPRDINDHPARANRGIVTVVVILGILIVLGLGGLVYGIALKAGKLGQSDTENAAETPVRDTGIRNSDQRVIDMVAESGRLYVHVLLEDGRDAVYVYNSEGQKLHEIILFPAD